MPASANAARVFAKRDWLAFAITSILVFVVYWFCISSDVDLESSGIYATAATHAGVGCPPGYPQWTLITWLFVHALPFGNVAGRIALSSALAGALATGLIALMGCKAAAVAMEQVNPDISQRDSNRIAAVSGSVGAMAFAFSNDFWWQAVSVSAQAFNILLFCMVLTLAMRWMFEREQRLYLYAAFFFYGIAITSGQSLISASVGLQFLVVLGDRELGRDLVLVNGALLVIGLALKSFGWFPMLESTLLAIYIDITVITLAVASILVIITRNAFSEWKGVLVAVGLMTTATLTYFVVPILSMTNPPVNWAYPRSVDGFFHLLMRGQFERLNPTTNLWQLIQQLKIYAQVAARDFGWFYIGFAAVPLLVLKRLAGKVRTWIAGLVVVFLCTIVLWLEFMNPSLDRQSVALMKTYFAASYILLAIPTSIGLALVAVITGTRHTKLNR